MINNSKAMSPARERILARLKQRPIDATAISESSAQIPRYSGTLESMIKQLQSNHTEVIPCTVAEFSEQLNELLQRQNVLTATSSAHPELLRLLEPSSLQCELKVTNDNYNQEQIFESCELSICMAEAGVMEPGCLLVASSTEQPRGLSLIPPINILVLKQGTILPSLTDLFQSDHWPEQDLPSNMLLISGPSKTADIQQTLAFGAHGPKQLVVFILT